MSTRAQIPLPMLEQTFEMLRDWPESEHVERVHESDRILFSGTMALRGAQVHAIIAERDKGRPHASKYDHRLVLGKVGQDDSVSIETIDLIPDHEYWVAGGDHYTVGAVESPNIPADTKLFVPHHGVDRPLRVDGEPQILMTQLMWEHVLN